MKQDRRKKGMESKIEGSSPKWSTVREREKQKKSNEHKESRHKPRGSGIQCTRQHARSQASTFISA